MTVYVNIKRPVFKGFNTIWSLLTEESRPTEENNNLFEKLYKITILMLYLVYKLLGGVYVK